MSLNTESVLSSWNELNEIVLTLSEEDLEKLLDAEKMGRKRKMFLLRIHSRLNRVRADRERALLIAAAGEK